VNRIQRWSIALSALGLASMPLTGLAQSTTTSTSASLGPGCDPNVQTALLQSSQNGANNSLGRIRNAFTPHISLSNLSCLNTILNSVSGMNLLFNPSALLQSMLNEAINFACSAISQEVATVEQPFNANSFFASIPGASGLSTASTSGSGSLQSLTGSTANSSQILSGSGFPNNSGVSLGGTSSSGSSNSSGVLGLFQ
jgi:hypothetical protein